ncbi:MAG: hypothetical protein WB820_21150 [Rhodoplanes sp.]
MFKLTSDQADTVLRAARPLQSADYDAFLQDVTEALAGCPELGPGIVHRVCRDIQRKYWDPPHRTTGPAPHHK